MGWKPVSSSDETEPQNALAEEDVRLVLKKPATKRQDKNKEKSEDTETENAMKRPAAKKDNHDRDELFKGGMPDDTNSDGPSSGEHDDDDEEPRKKPAAMKSLNLSFCKQHQIHFASCQWFLMFPLPVF